MIHFQAPVWLSLKIRKILEEKHVVAAKIDNMM